MKKNPKKTQPATNRKLIAGINIQFNRIEVAVFNLDHQVISSKDSPLTAGDDPLPVCIALLNALLTDNIKESLISVGVAFPGIIEKNKTYVKYSTDFPEYEDRPIGEEIKLALNINVPFFVERNAVCDLIYLANVKSIKANVVLLSLKSGISAAVQLEGIILRGVDDNIGAFGHLTLENSRKACMCGKNGCIETEISETAWERKYAEIKRKYYAGEKNNLPATFKKAIEQGNHQALEILRESIHALYPRLGQLILFLNPRYLFFATNLPPSTLLIFSTALKELNKGNNIIEVPELFFADSISTLHGAALLGLSGLSGSTCYKAI